MVSSTIACKAERRLGVLRRNLRKLAAVQKAKSREVSRTKMITESTISTFYKTPAIQNMKHQLTKKPNLLDVKAAIFVLIPFRYIFIQHSLFSACLDGYDFYWVERIQFLLLLQKHTLTMKTFNEFSCLSFSILTINWWLPYRCARFPACATTSSLWSSKGIWSDHVPSTDSQWPPSCQELLFTTMQRRPCMRSQCIQAGSSQILS